MVSQVRKTLHIENVDRSRACGPVTRFARRTVGFGADVMDDKTVALLWPEPQGTVRKCDEDAGGAGANNASNVKPQAMISQSLAAQAGNRGGEIWTHGLLVPNQAREIYEAIAAQGFIDAAIIERCASVAPWLARFWSKVEIKPSGCWEWTASLVRGYGSFKPSKKVNWKAHRLAYLMAHGSLDPALDVLHSCDNKPCCNPAHLREGTHKENMDDREARGLQEHVRGSRHGRSKLKENQVREIRRMLANRERPETIAESFGVSRSTVAMIACGGAWGWLQ